jgi:hypothetical protein
MKTAKLYDAGFASAQLLIMLVFISMISSGAAMYLSGVLSADARAAEYTKTVENREKILSAIMEALAADPSPQSNGPEDPLWAWDGKTCDGWDIGIVPLSDRLNPNYIRKNVFEKTGLGTLFNPGADSRELQQWREDRGLSLRDDHYRHFFNSECYEA